MTDDEIRRHPIYREVWFAYKKWIAGGKKGRALSETGESMAGKYPYPLDLFTPGSDYWLHVVASWSAMGKTHRDWPANLPPLDPEPEIVQMELF